jgi:LacI family transcriptional regulator
VLNGTKYVSPAVREKVLTVIDALNYQPNVAARSLRRQETQSIGVLVPQLNDFFFSNLAFAIEKTLFDEGYSPLFSSTEESHDKENACVSILIRNRVEGVIFVPSISKTQSVEQVRRLLERGIAVVLVDRGLPELRVNQVLSNNFQGGYDAVRYLIDMGHRHIGVVDSGVLGLASKYGPGYDRINGVRQAMLDSGLHFDDNLLLLDNLPAIDMGYQGAMRLLRQSPHITAIFALTDACAVGVLRAAFELGLRVPGDLSVVGFDDLPLASHVVPRLTTVSQPVEKIGQTAAQLLLRQIREPDAIFETIMVATRLVMRESSAPPKR